MSTESYGHADFDPQEALHFWFEETDSKQHFAKSADFDAAIRRRLFGTNQQRRPVSCGGGAGLLRAVWQRSLCWISSHEICFATHPSTSPSMGSL